MPTRLTMTTLTCLLLALPVRAQHVVAIEHVTILPMDSEHRLLDQTVVIRDGRITDISAAAHAIVPTSAVRIDGRGKFLIPGLSDMHAHLVPGAGEISDGAGRQLALSLAAGVTTVRSLISPPSALALRERLRRGDIRGPRLILAGSSVNGSSAPTPASVVAMVTQQHADGYDLIKTHGQFGDPASYDSLVAVTRRLDMPLVGHVTPEFGLAKAMDVGQQVEHLDGFLSLIVLDSITAPGSQFVFDEVALGAVDSTKLRTLAQHIARRGLWNAPTLELFRIIAGTEPAASYLAREEMRFVPKAALDAWVSQKNAILGQPIPATARTRFLEVRNQIVLALHTAGARLLASSDSPQFFMTPGFGVHRELQAMVDAGLSPFAALASATRNPAEWFGELAHRGTVEVGKVADLVLLDSDPLLDIAHTMRIAGVMAAGSWHSAGALEQLKAEVAREVGK